MKKLCILFAWFTLTFSMTVFSQKIDSSLINYNWNENRKIYPVNPDDNQFQSIVLLNKSVIEYVFENNDFVQYSLEHMIIRVNSDAAIESYNKINISMRGTIDIINIKARTISKDGKVVNLNKSNIKEIKGDEETDASKIFAIEGAEKGCEIEYFYVKKLSPILYGHDIWQFGSPVKEAFFQLIVPSHLRFKFKPYNGYAPIKDTIINEKEIYTASLTNIPPIDEEPSSNLIKNRMRMEYKLAYNLAKSKKEIYGWADIAQSQFTALHTLTSKESKAVEKLYAELNKPDLISEELKIKAIEGYIKSNIVLQEIYKDDLSSLDKIIQNKFSNKNGVIKLYSELFKLAGVNSQVVLTSDRTLIPFDGTFESWRFLNNYLFYFPNFDKYLSPEEIFFRYPMIPANLTLTQGLFLKTVSVGGFETFVPIVKYIKPLDYKSSAHVINAEIEFTPSMTELHINITSIFKGYYGAYVLPYYSQTPDDKKIKLLEELMKEYTKDSKFTSISAQNTDINQSIIDFPFSVKAELTGTALLENAGNKILLKIGEIIGKQVEMYQEKNRKLDVEDSYNREFPRDIKIKIPKGYSIKNLNDININHVYKNNDEEIYKFISSYSLSDNTLNIKIEEFYKEMQCPVTRFKEYQNVVNAAADFNKVTLIFEPN